MGARVAAGLVGRGNEHSPPPSTPSNLTTKSRSFLRHLSTNIESIPQQRIPPCRVIELHYLPIATRAATRQPSGSELCTAESCVEKARRSLGGVGGGEDFRVRYSMFLLVSELGAFQISGGMFGGLHCSIAAEAWTNGSCGRLMNICRVGAIVRNSR